MKSMKKCSHIIVTLMSFCEIIATTDCLDLYTAGVKSNGVYKVYPSGWAESGFDVFCDMESHGGGWTVFQQRFDGTVDFYRNWTSYKKGFGKLTGEFWLGNDKIHTLTTQGKYQLRIDVMNSRGVSYYNLYKWFSVTNENDKYRIYFGPEMGNTGGNPLGISWGQPFSTYDQDNDDTDRCNCASKHRGAWWYKYKTYISSSNAECWKWTKDNIVSYCGNANLNGGYQKSGVKSIYLWYGDHDFTNDRCGCTRTLMKIRRDKI